MRHINYYIALLLVTMIASCAEDKGNYDYTSLNDVVVERFNEGKAYVTSIGKTITIETNLTYKLNEKPDDFSYLWIIGADTVSKEKNLVYTVPERSPYGNTDCNYVVTNKLNGMKYFRPFSINVVSLFNWGFYILTKAPDNSSQIAFLSTEENAEFITTSKIGTYDLGDNPSSLSGTFGMISALDDSYWTIYVSTKEGENPTIVTDCATFLPRKMINENSFADQQVRKYSPDKVSITPQDEVYILSDGKIIRQIEDFLYRPGSHDKEYYWSEISFNWNGMCLFDNLSKEFYIVNPTESDPAAGTVGDPYAYDAVMPIEDCPNFSERKIIDCYVDFYNSYENDNHIITSVSEEGIAIDTVIYNYNEGRAYFSKGVLITGAPISKSSCGTRVNITDWYFGVGDKIYSSPDMLHKLTLFYTIPADFGEIIEVKSSVKGSSLAVTTYNKSSKKGSFILIDIQSGAAKTYKDVMNEPISLFCADDSKW